MKTTGKWSKVLLLGMFAMVLSYLFCSCLTIRSNPDSIVGYRDVDSSYARMAKANIGKTVAEASQTYSKMYGPPQSSVEGIVIFDKQTGVTSGTSSTVSASRTDTGYASVSTTDGTASVGASASNTVGASATNSSARSETIHEGVQFNIEGGRIKSYVLLGLR
jgi:hypothetical protein